MNRKPLCSSCKPPAMTCIGTVLVAILLFSTSALAAPPPADATLPDLLQRLAGDGPAVSIESLDDYMAWRSRLQQGTVEVALPAFQPNGPRALMRFLIRKAPIEQADGLFENDIPVLDRLQSDAIPLVLASGDTSYLPVLSALYQRHITRAYWPIIETERMAIRAMNGDAPATSIYEGPDYYVWLKRQGFYAGLQNLLHESDLEEKPAGEGKPLYDRPPATSSDAVPYDDARAVQILSKSLPALINERYLNSNLAHWLRFSKDGSFRAGWSLHNVRFYVRGAGQRVQTLVLILDEPLDTAEKLQERLGSVVKLGDIKSLTLPAPGRDVETQSAGARVRCGLRHYRQGNFLAVRIEY